MPPKNAKAATAAPANQTPSGRPVLYPKIEVSHCYSKERGGLGPITVEQAKAMMGWEAEDDYKRRLEAEATRTGDVTIGAKAKVGYGDEFLLRDAKGKKVRCWNNALNRPFDEKHCRGIAQTILSKQYWLNLETVVISLTGLVTSGQHRLIGLILAHEMWEKDKSHWNRFWLVAPTIESLIAFGGSEDPKVLQTIDNVKPRSLSDVFYTSPVFADKKTKDRLGLSRCMETAVEYFWKRTAAGTGTDAWNKYQTHVTSMDLLDRHPKLLECVKHVYEQNDGSDNSLRIRAGVQTGQAAAVMYLMGSAKTKPEEYDAARSEKVCNWDYYEKAKRFWTLIAIKDKAMDPLVEVIGRILDPEEEAVGNYTEKFGIICRAWMAFASDKPIRAGEISLEDLYGRDANDRVTLTEVPIFGGLDRGIKIRKAEAAPSPEQIQKAAAEERARREAEAKAPTKPAPKAKGKAPVKVGPNGQVQF